MNALLVLLKFIILGVGCKIEMVMVFQHTNMGWLEQPHAYAPKFSRHHAVFLKKLEGIKEYALSKVLGFQNKYLTQSFSKCKKHIMANSVFIRNKYNKHKICFLLS